METSLGKRATVQRAGTLGKNRILVRRMQWNLTWMLVQARRAREKDSLKKQRTWKVGQDDLEIAQDDSDATKHYSEAGSSKDMVSDVEARAEEDASLEIENGEMDCKHHSDDEPSESEEQETEPDEFQEMEMRRSGREKYPTQKSIVNLEQEANKRLDQEEQLKKARERKKAKAKGKTKKKTDADERTKRRAARKPAALTANLALGGSRDTKDLKIQNETLKIQEKKRIKNAGSVENRP